MTYSPTLKQKKNSHDPLSKTPRIISSPQTEGEGEGRGLPFFGEPFKEDVSGGGNGKGRNLPGRAQRMEAIGTLTCGIAHDFNNILTPILLRSEMAMAQLQQDSPVRNQLEQILNCGQRARDLVQQILNFSHQDESKPRPLQIALVVKEMLKFLRSSLPATIEIQQDIRGSGMVLADLGLIHMLVMELCARSCQPVAATGGLLEISLNETEQEMQKIDPLLSPPERTYLKLTVKRHGMGTPVAKGGSEPGVDTAMIHSIVEQHGGKVVVTRDFHEGVTFDVFLPKMESKASATGPQMASLPRGSENVLLVEDEKDILEILEQMLTHLGYTVVSTTSGAEALEIFMSSPNRFDMMITDQTMPGMTGLRLAEEVNRVRPELPLLLCSGFGEIIDNEELRKVGARSLLVKPFNASQIALKVREVLDGVAEGS
jgi:two-component system, cell cycle sensor histidine kinase and response regulator CckA